MTLNQAAAYYVPAGEHRGRPLACLALDHPDYLDRLAEHGAAECPKGGQFHEAVTLVVEQLRRNAEDDILAGRTVAPADLAAAVAECGGGGRLAPATMTRGRKATTDHAPPAGAMLFD